VGSTNILNVSSVHERGVPCSLVSSLNALHDVPLYQSVPLVEGSHWGWHRPLLELLEDRLGQLLH